MLNLEDHEFIKRVNRSLMAGLTYQEIADSECVPLGTMYARIRRLGYQTAKRLVPIHAKPLDSDSEPGSQRDVA